MTAPLNWLLWWRIAPEAMRVQLDRYRDLGIHESARGISFLCLIFAALLAMAWSQWGGAGPEGLRDALILIFLGVAIYFGHRWASLAAMLFWSLESALVAFTQVGSIVSLLWWCVYMHAFWWAFRVEGRRRLEARHGVY